MAIHGLSLAEVDRFILPNDPAHPDNIKSLFDLRSVNMETQEQRDALLAKIEDEAGKPTVFLLGNLLQEDRVFLSDMAGGMEQTPQGNLRMVPKNAMKASEAVRRALRGWENFADSRGVALAFSTAPGMGERGQPRSFVSPEAMAMLTLDTIAVLSKRILELNGVTSDLEKKLQDALLPVSAPPSLGGPVANAQTETNSNEDAESQA